MPRRTIARTWSVGLIALLAGCGSSPPPSASASSSAPLVAVSPSVAASRSPSPGTSSVPAPTAVATPPLDPVDVRLAPVVEGLVAPVGLVADPVRPERSYVLEQDGRILVLDGGEIADRPFLDVRSSMVELMPDYDERGLLGLAFHPGFGSNGRLFVYRGVPSSAAGADHTNRLSEFHVDKEHPDRVDPRTERILLEFDQPQFNHSGGGLGFGPDGLLYLGTGDGGGQGDASEGHSPQGNAQDLEKLNGKILRIDVDRSPGDGAAYAIPPDNPFGRARSERQEIYAWGFRNPWRLGWEPDGQRRLLVSDVGYGRYEEIDVVVRGGNYGWRIREGAHCLDVAQPLVDMAACPTTGTGGEALIDPVVEYTHRGVGIAVVGGYVYRGSDVPELRGRYVFADLSKDWTGNNPVPRGSLLVADPVADAGRPWAWDRLGVNGAPLLAEFVSGMGEDSEGELYVLTRSQLGPTGTSGRVLRIAPSP